MIIVRQATALTSLSALTLLSLTAEVAMVNCQDKKQLQKKNGHGKKIFVNNWFYLPIDSTDKGNHL